MSNIDLFKVRMTEDAIQASSDVLRSGYIGQGPVVENFERALIARFGRYQLVTTNSATSAMHLALSLLKNNDKDEVITTPMTCVATNTPILQNNLKIKWADSDPRSGNIDLDDVERKLSRRTLAIVVVHWGGNPCDLKRLHEIQLKCYRLYGTYPTVIEDCAHAFGSTCNERLVGTHGNMCVFSFQAIKHLTCGDGGMLIVPDHLYERAVLLRWYGFSREVSILEQDLVEVGHKFHMNDISASIGLANLKNIDLAIAKHQENAAYLMANLKNVEFFETLPDSKSAYWVLPIRVENRQGFIRHMAKNSITVSQVHGRNDILSAFSEYKCCLPGVDKLDKEMICIPCGWWLDQAECNKIIETVNNGW